MTIKAVLDSEQFGELDESLKGLYEEAEDGNYNLNAEGVDELPSIQGLKNGMQNAKRERTQARKEADALKRRFAPLLEIDDLDLSDIDSERVQTLLPYLTGEAEIPTGDGKDGERKTPEELERIRQNARKPLEKDLAKVQQQAQQYEALFRRECVTNTLLAEFGRAGVKDADFLELLVERYSPKCKINISEEGDAEVVIDSEYGEVSPKEFCKEWAGTDYARKFINAPNNQGGGAGGGANGAKLKNPWAPDGWNMTEQARIFKTDPERAKRMAAEHGKSLGA
jgi:hypothetical protein